MNDPIRKCAGCDTPLLPTPRQRNKKKWCSGACRQRHLRATDPRVKQNARDNYIKRRDARRADRMQELESNPLPTCGNCEETLRRHGQRYCSKPECRSAKYYAEKDHAPPCTIEGCNRPEQAKGMCSSHYAARWARANPDRATAMRHRYRARKMDAWVEDVSRADILERDLWTCHLCNMPIPQDAQWPSLAYGTLDHVIPLNVGGLHELGNVKAAHFLCNTSKGDREEWEPNADILQRVRVSLAAG